MSEHWWTIQVTYTAWGDDGRAFQARSVIQVQAETIHEAYAVAQRSGWKLGAICPGKHMRLP